MNATKEKMEKLVITQIPPEMQESPICDSVFEEGDWLEKVTIDGNPDRRPHMSKAYMAAAEIIDEWDNLWSCAPDEEYKEAAEECANIVDRIALYDALYYYRYASGWEEEMKCLLMQAVTGEKYKSREIHGVVPGDWQRCYYPEAEWDDAALQDLERQYFNTGSEWVWEESSGNDTWSCTHYSTAWSDEEIVTDLLGATGRNRDETEIRFFAGYTKEPIYKTV